MNRVILPLDGMTMERATETATQLRDLVWGFKVNDLLIDEGLASIRKLKFHGNVMADPKLYDIPATMNNSIDKLIEAGADIITVHGSAMYHGELDQKAKLAMVTILTTFDEDKCNLIYSEPIAQMVKRFSSYATLTGYGYMVSSAQQLETLNPLPMKKICPGIRPSSYSVSDDQKQTMTPGEAIKAGADLLVIGRPILKADDPVKMLKEINEEIAKAVSEEITQTE